MQRTNESAVRAQGVGWRRKTGGCRRRRSENSPELRQMPHQGMNRKVKGAGMTAEARAIHLRWREDESGNGGDARRGEAGDRAGERRRGPARQPGEPTVSEAEPEETQEYQRLGSKLTGTDGLARTRSDNHGRSNSPEHGKGSTPTVGRAWRQFGWFARMLRCSRCTELGGGYHDEVNYGGGRGDGGAEFGWGRNKEARERRALELGRRRNHKRRKGSKLDTAVVGEEAIGTRPAVTGGVQARQEIKEEEGTGDWAPGVSEMDA